LVDYYRPVRMCLAGSLGRDSGPDLRVMRPDEVAYPPYCDRQLSDKIKDVPIIVADNEFVWGQGGQRGSVPRGVDAS
jgi:hypothetical protein